MEARRPFHVVIAGGGVAALETALGLRALAGDLVQVELVAPEADFTYRPLAVAEPFRVGEVRRFPLERLVAAAGASLRRGVVRRVDPEQKTVTLDEDRTVNFDAFVLAVGARPRDAVVGALTFRGPQDGPALSTLLEQAADGNLQRIAFVVPAGASWPLPLYELALMTAEYLTDRGTRGVEVVIVTPEEHPLALFGNEASDAIQELLELRGVQLRTGVAATAWREGLLAVAGGPAIDADAAVSLPQLLGPALEGIPHDGAGFVPTDAEGRVAVTTDVYAAGDATQFRPKQGGLAAQQADAVAAAIAIDLGADVEPMPFRPVLRGLLLTGLTPRYLRGDAISGSSLVDTEPLWWPPAKIVGRYLAPFLAAQLGQGRRSPRPRARAPWRTRSSSIRTAVHPGRRSEDNRGLTTETRRPPGGGLRGAEPAPASETTGAPACRAASTTRQSSSGGALRRQGR
jgi:sulfide:quinone oxidoreductase